MRLFELHVYRNVVNNDLRQGCSIFSNLLTCIALYQSSCIHLLYSNYIVIILTINYIPITFSIQAIEFNFQESFQYMIELASLIHCIHRSLLFWYGHKFRILRGITLITLMSEKKYVMHFTLCSLSNRCPSLFHLIHKLLSFIWHLVGKGFLVIFYFQ